MRRPQSAKRLSRKLVGATGFEPATPWSRTKCATRLRYAPTFAIVLNLHWLFGRPSLVADQLHKDTPTQVCPAHSVVFSDSLPQDLAVDVTHWNH